jgi:hypothetical protein
MALLRLSDLPELVSYLSEMLRPSRASGEASADGRKKAPPEDKPRIDPKQTTIDDHLSPSEAPGEPNSPPQVESPQ